MNMPLTIDWQQILLHLFNFSILAGGLYLLLYRPVKNFMKKREAYYQSMDQQARQDRERASQLQKEYQARLDAVGDEIAQRRAAAQKELEQFRAQQIDAAQREAGEIVPRAQASARREHEKMLSAASQELADLAVTATEKIVLTAQGDPYELFLNLAEKGVSSDERAQ